VKKEDLSKQDETDNCYTSQGATSDWDKRDGGIRRQEKELGGTGGLGGRKKIFGAIEEEFYQKGFIQEHDYGDTSEGERAEGKRKKGKTVGKRGTAEKVPQL